MLLVFADDVNLLGDRIDTIDKTKFMYLSHHQNVGQISGHRNNKQMV
jgi:hypothetical protein